MFKKISILIPDKLYLINVTIHFDDLKKEFDEDGIHKAENTIKTEFGVKGAAFEATTHFRHQNQSRFVYR